MIEFVGHVKKLFELMSPVLDERTERLLAAAMATSLGPGGTAAVTEATGIRSKRIAAGKRDLREIAKSPESPLLTRVRRPGGGRKSIEVYDPKLVEELQLLIEPTTRGDPESPLRWTTKSLRRLSEELTTKGHRVGRTMVGELLHGLGYSLQANSKRIEGKQHPDRDAQFRHISRRTKTVQRQGAPVISVDTKKKELVGAFANKGREWRPYGEPVAVRVHDFLDDRAVGKAVPYGIYDLGRDEGFVNVGTSADTGEFAVASIRTWWKTMGRKAYPNAKRLYIVADGGGSNGARNSLWKAELQRFADKTGLQIEVSHMPPGTSKWNKIEHRLFSAISMNWRGKPLESFEAVVSLIAATTTRSDLRVRAKLDERTYERGIKVPREVIHRLAIRQHTFHGNWNYVLRPSG
jgi:Rhodopirellula transposase DDE domain